MKSKREFDGYLYTQSVCLAIEKYTSSEENRKSSVFFYRNANLRFAVERALYVAFVNNDRLFKIFGDWQNNNLPTEIILSNQLEKDILLNMCDINPDHIYIASQDISYRLKNILKVIFKQITLILCLNRIAKFTRELLNQKNFKRKHYQILLSIRSERFAKYLEPIAEKIPVSFAYITYNKKTTKYLKSKNLPYIKISRAGYFLERFTHGGSIVDQFGISDQYDYLYEFIKGAQPTSVLVVEGNAPHDEIVNQICKQTGIQSICLQQGWSPIIHNGFRNMTYTKMLVWGDGFAKDLTLFNPNQRFVSTGSHIIKLSDTKTTRKSGYKIKIGFLPPMPTKILSENNYNRFMGLVPWVANKFKDVEIVVSEHPTIVNNQRFSELANYDNVKFLSSKIYSLQEIIEGNNISVSFFSTTILESIAAGSLPIIVNLTSMPHHIPDINIHGAGIEVRSIDEAKNIITELVNNPEKISAYKTRMEKFRKEYFAYDRDKAIDNIIKEMTS